MTCVYVAFIKLVFKKSAKKIMVLGKTFYYMNASRKYNKEKY